MKSTGLLVLALFVTPLFAASSSPEESAVRDVYARAAYSAELGSINSTILGKLNQHSVTSADIEKARDDGRANFVLSDFHLLSRADFTEVRFDSLELGGSTVLAMILSSHGVTEPGGVTTENEYRPMWSTADVTWKIDPSLYTWVKEIASYTVSASFKGETRSATAYAFFGDSRREIRDELVVSVSFNQVVDAYPKLMLHSGAFDSPSVRAYLKQSQIESGCCGPLTPDVTMRLSQAPNSTDTTPLPKAMTAATITPDDIQSSCAAYSFSYPNYVAPEFTDATQHARGFHYLGPTVFTGQCRYSNAPTNPEPPNNCLAVASANIVSSGSGESVDSIIGVGYGYHEPSTSPFKNVSQSAIAPATPTATAAVGFAAIQCADTPLCQTVGVSLSAGLGVTFPPHTVWGQENDHSFVCPSAVKSPGSPGDPPGCPDCGGGGGPGQ